MSTNKHSLGGINKAPVNHTSQFCLAAVSFTIETLPCFQGCSEWEWVVQPRFPPDTASRQGAISKGPGSCWEFCSLSVSGQREAPLPSNGVRSFDSVLQTGTPRTLRLCRTPWSPSRENPTVSVNRTPFSIIIATHVRTSQINLAFRDGWKQQVSKAMHCVQRR